MISAGRADWPHDAPGPTEPPKSFCRLLIVPIDVADLCGDGPTPALKLSPQHRDQGGHGRGRAGPLVRSRQRSWPARRPTGFPGYRSHRQGWSYDGDDRSGGTSARSGAGCCSKRRVPVLAIHHRFFRMPGDQSLPVFRDLRRSLSNIGGSIEQEKKRGEYGLARRASTVVNPIPRRRSDQCSISE
jgi:hypothetical protein